MWYMGVCVYIICQVRFDPYCFVKILFSLLMRGHKDKQNNIDVIYNELLYILISAIYYIKWYRSIMQWINFSNYIRFLYLILVCCNQREIHVQLYKIHNLWHVKQFPKFILLSAFLKYCHIHCTRDIDTTIDIAQ